jgi:hypothetical protein
MNAGYVYILRNKDQCKIGFSASPKSRVANLSKRNSIKNPEYWISEVCGDARLWESNCHENLFEKRIKGEWFKIDINDAVKIAKSLRPTQKYINTLNNYEGSFSVHTKSKVIILEILESYDLVNPLVHDIQEVIRDALEFYKKECKQ